jgi:AraC-like DNA-binding protein
MGETERHWSTKKARPGEALSYWVEAICEAFLEMKADSPEPSNFSASITQHPFGPIDLNFADTTSQQVWRTPQAIAGSRKHTYYLLYVREGRLGARQRGRDAAIEPGDCVLIDSMEPYSFSFPETNRCLSIQMPHDWLRNWIPEPEKIVATSFATNSGWGRTLASAAGNLAECDYDSMALPRGVVADQLGALLALAAGNELAGASTHRHAWLHRIRKTLLERLSDPSLDPQSVADLHGISKRYLHLLFAGAGTSFGAALIDLRLERAKQLLDDRRLARVGVAEIAWRCGFREPSHFARRFRARFGSAPDAYRKTLHS